jgi:hypothetical protein
MVDINKKHIIRRVDGFFIMNASSVLSANVQKVDLKKWGRVMIDVCFFLPIEEVISMRINLGKGLI